VYSIWLRCDRRNVLWWDGALANQPHVLMLEFDVCDSVQSQLANWKNNVQRILGEK
jgi:prepilin-type processing-associated H-X9-DG protein